MSVLLLLEQEGPLTTSALARLQAMPPQSMGTIVTALQGLGFVAGAPDPADGRRTLLVLTDRCRTGILDVRAARQEWLNRTIASRLSPDEQQRLADALPLLDHLADG